MHLFFLPTWVLISDGRFIHTLDVWTTASRLHCVRERTSLPFYTCCSAFSLPHKVEEMSASKCLPVLLGHGNEQQHLFLVLPPPHPPPLTGFLFVLLCIVLRAFLSSHHRVTSFLFYPWLTFSPSLYFCLDKTLAVICPPVSGTWPQVKRDLQSPTNDSAYYCCLHLHFCID